MMIFEQAAVVPSTNPWRTYTVSIQSVQREVEGVSTYDLAFVDEEDASRYGFRPGQFNMLYVPGAGEVPISLSADPQSSQSWAHTIRVAGRVTAALASLPTGATLGLRGPFGTSWPMSECIGRDVVLVAGGIGLAPLRPAIYELLAKRRQFGRLNLLYGARSPDTLLYPVQYDAWSHGGLIVQTTVDRDTPDWTGNVGVVPLLLERLRTFDPRSAILFACGPELMMKYTIKTALERGMHASQIWVSLERNMHCGVGFCGHCQLGPAFICKDGPVVRHDQIASCLRVEGY